ncbi:MAG: AAA family ATPase, partial [Candidatus Poribacteria bacterium]|nr:AAA family ATPase [Candidatus Poribacteria bacterium]
YAPLTLDAIEVSKARYMGRSQSFTIEFNPWFNAIIGGRGTGKSTVVEFLRIALRREDELPGALQSEFEQYSDVYQDREESGLLTDEASIRVIYRKDGDLFRIQWNPSGGLEPIEQKIDGQWQRAEGDIRQRFPVRIYSQKQVFQLAKTPLALLKIIDEAPEVGYQAWSKKWKVEESRFLSIRAKAREIKAGLGEKPRLLGELDDVKRSLAIFEQSGHAEILKSFQKLSRQYREIEAWEKSWTGTGELLRRVAAEIVPDLPDGSSFDWNSAPDKELQKLTAKTRDRLDEIRKSVKDLSSQTNDIVAEWRKSKEESSWRQSVDAAEQAYRKLQDDLAREGISDPAAYGALVQRQQTIEQQLNELDERKKHVDDLNKDADACLQNLLKIRQELTASREKFLKHVLNGNQYVRIQVAPYGAHEMVESEFRQLLQKEDGTFEKDIGSPDGAGLLGAIYRNSGLAQDIEQNLLNIKTRVKKIASGENGMGIMADRRFATHVSNLPPELIDRLDMWFPEDSLEVQYSARGDGQGFRSIQEGSPGQRTAALLAFLLSYGDEPLILDQPEDDLDNHLIYDLIVTQLRANKRHRQVIVVTHNANIVVNGDAEQVLALAARSGETQKECEGSLQEQQVRDTICTIMEGGRRAFEDRYRRIALKGRPV